MGHTALNNTTTGYNTGFGFEAGYYITTGSANTAVGYQALKGSTNSTASNNTALGQVALYANTTGANNTALGRSALVANTTGAQNTAIGQRCMNNNTTGSDNTIIGRDAGYSFTSCTRNVGIGYSAGSQITTGSKNSILGSYNGNQGGLDIRTASNYIVLSDGNGNPRFVNDGSNTIVNGYSTATNTNHWYFTNNGYGAVSNSDGAYNSTRLSIRAAGTVIGSIFAFPTSVAFNTTSDYRLKENVVAVSDASTRVQQLNPVRFNFIGHLDRTVDGFIAHEVSDIVPEAITGEKDAVDEDGNPEYQGIDQSKLVPLLTAALQEALNKIDQLETRIEALEA
jgi:hypothetical protein